MFLYFVLLGQLQLSKSSSRHLSPAEAAARANPAELG